MRCDDRLYDNVTGILISAAILFTALAWRDCLIDWVDRHPYVTQKGPWVYASVVTGISILVVVFLMFPLKKLVCK